MSNEQLSPPFPMRANSRPSNILRPPVFLPFDEERDFQSQQNKSNGQRTTIEIESREHIFDTGPQRPSSLLCAPNTDVTNEAARVFPEASSPRKGFHNLPSINVYQDTPHHTLSRYTSGENARPVPDTPANEIAVPFGASRIDYNELDEQLREELDFNNMSTVRLMQLSGVMQAISQPISTIGVSKHKVNPSLQSAYSSSQAELFERLSTQPVMAAISVTPKQIPAKPTSTWKALLNHPAAKLVLGILVGIVAILLLSRVINFKETTEVLEKHLKTPEGIMHACIGAAGFALAFTLRGMRWKLFLNRVSNISIFKVIRIYWVGVFINFLLPVQGGEVAKSIMLKRVAGIPVSQSLPIVAIDKTLDLMPVLVIIAIMPLIPGIHINITLLLVMLLVAGILISLMIVVGLTWWKRESAIQLIHFFLKFLPKKFEAQIEGFGMGFVDSLIEGLKRPRSFIPAAILTSLAIICEGVFAWQVSLAVGLDTMGLGLATFGYSIFTMFSILPTPPAQVGTSEAAKTLIFGSLLGFNKNRVLGMSLLSHVIGTVLMTVIGLVSIWSLGLTVKGVLNIKRERHEDNV